MRIECRDELRAQIVVDTGAFLMAGGVIEVVPPGASGLGVDEYLSIAFQISEERNDADE